MEPAIAAGSAAAGAARRGTRTWLQATLCAAATASTGLLYRDFFATGSYLPAVVGAAVAGAMLAGVAARRRWGQLSILSAWGGFALFAAFTVFPETLQHGIPTAQTASALAWGVGQGWAQMLTVSLPADVTGELLVTPVLLSWGASFAATSLALRTRPVVVPLAPPLAAFAAGLLFVASRPGNHLQVAGAFALAAYLLVLVRADKEDTPPRRGRAQLIRGLAMVVSVVLAGTAAAHAGTLASGENRFDPRELRPPALTLDDLLTPLATLKSELTETPPRRLFTVAVEGGGSAGSDRIRLAALDRFDGAVWSASGRYLPAGRTLSGNGAIRHGKTVTQHIVVTGLAGPFLPSIGWPVRLGSGTGRGADLWYNDRLGTLAIRTPVRPDFRYDVTALVPPRDEGLAVAEPTPPGPWTGEAALPDAVPAEIAALARELAAPATTPYAQLAAIERYLRSLPYSLDARAGHAYGTLLRMLDTHLPDGGRSYAEQRAAAFAVLARVLGFPARVSVGYLLRDGVDGRYTVTTRDAHAWAEVSFEGYGWVPFEPTDTSRLPAHPRQEPAVRSAANQPGAGGAQPQPGRGAGLQTSAPGPDSPGPRTLPAPSGHSGDGHAAARVVGLLALAAAAFACLVVLALAAIVAAKAGRRRRRRRAGTAAELVLGAWQEAGDRLVEYGLSVPLAATAQEVAERAVATIGAPAATLTGLADLATSAVFAAQEPDVQAVERAWALESTLRRELRANHGPLSRMRATLDPLPLLATRHRRSGAGRRPVAAVPKRVPP